MGSDLSKPKNKKHLHKNDCPDSNIPKRNSRTICYDLPECYDPCSNAIKYPPIQLPPLPRQQPRYPRDPCRDLFDPCHDYYDRSTIVSNLQLSPRTSTRKLICYECPEKGVSSRSPRYKTVKPALKREDTFLDDCDYKEERNRKDSDRRDRDRDRDRRYTVVNSNNQQYYSDNKNGKLNEEFDGIPKDRIYEIRKEKILIKADKSPERTQERYRSKSSEKYLDSKYDDGHGSYKVYERDDTGNNNGIRKQLQSRSVYVLKDDRESSPERQSYSDHKYSNKNSSNANQTSSVNAPAISTVGNSDIVYVPMVKEDFIKRECKKLENINTEQSIKYTPKTQRRIHFQEPHQQQHQHYQSSINQYSLPQPSQQFYINPTPKNNTTNTATSPFSPISKPKNFKKVIISESFPIQKTDNLHSTSIPITFDNNLLKIRINHDSSKTSTPVSTTPTQLSATAEFKTPNLPIRKTYTSNSSSQSASLAKSYDGNSNLVDQIKINLNNSKRTGLVYSRYVYTDSNQNKSETHNYENIIEDEHTIMQQQEEALKLREKSVHLNDLMASKNATLSDNTNLNSFHRF